MLPAWIIEKRRRDEMERSERQQIPLRIPAPRPPEHRPPSESESGERGVADVDYTIRL